MTPEEYKESEEYKKSIKYAFENFNENVKKLWSLEEFKDMVVIFLLGLGLIYLIFQ